MGWLYFGFCVGGMFKLGHIAKKEKLTQRRRRGAGYKNGTNGRLVYRRRYQNAVW